MAIKPYLQLVRLPNVFTAAADSLAGWLLVRGTFDEPRRWLPLVVASMAIYAAGIALNDYFDFELDLEERPSRPLPSGKVSRRFAAGLAVGLLALGLASAGLSGSAASLGVAGLLVLCVIVYDAGARRSVFGPELMGTCRGLNVLLGMSQAADLGGPPAWLVGASMAVFVAGVTWISRSETHSGRTGGILAGIVLQNAAVLGLAWAALRARAFPSPDASRPIVPTEGLALLMAVLLIVDLAGARAIRNPEPGTVQRAVKTGVLALVWLDVAAVAAVRGLGPASAVAALWVPAFVLSRWLYAT